MSEECKNNCPYATVIQDLTKDSQRNSTQHRDFYARLNEIDTSIAISTERYSNLITAMTELKDGLKDLKVAISELKEKPAKKWDQVSMYVVTTVVGGIIGVVLSGLF